MSIRPREEVLKAFKALFTKQKDYNPATWSHRSYNDPDYAWGLGGEFGILSELRFEKHLARLYEHRDRSNQAVV